MRTRSSRSNSSDRQIIGVLSALTAAVRRVAAGTPKPQPRPVQPQPKLGRKVLFESLEQRILLSADPVAAVTDGALDVDLTDNPDQMACGLNVSEACTRTAAYIGVFNSIDHTVPKNAGAPGFIRLT